ncbi:putative bifunctional diguanylate cyclase/phosphodiesterase [Leeia oryzae]|uniref:putative bifunctional diguanylate cyclase/phosphodiesterase n=1 Tax=Leeia oryzae TaxID=356662 RepID=UPI000367E71D|nr:EAL domain-containing protein [Leeia oryzae]
MNAIPSFHTLATIVDYPDVQRILLVDDEPRFRSAYRELLAGEGRQIDEAATGQEALQFLGTREIDVVVLDLKLPDITGMEVMDWLVANHISTSVIVFSADESIDSAIHALRQGAFEFIRKHGDPDQMIRTVDKALRHRRLEKEHALMTARLEQSERLHRFLVDQSPDLIYTLDKEGNFIFVNRRFETLLGYDPNELIGLHYSTVLYDEDRERVQYAFNERRVGERATSNFEVRLKGKQQDVRHFDNRMIVTILSSQGVYSEQDHHAPHYVGTSGVARDITERKRAEEMIIFQAFHDLLTSLPNRTLFMDRLGLAITQAKRRDEQLGVMFLDIDRFKLINDSYGHQEGDRFLKEFAERVLGCLRSGDTLARQGGDEFTILLPDVSCQGDVAVIAQKVLAELRRPFKVAGCDFLATASIGIAMFPEDGDTPEALIRSADIAMYQTKSQGKNGYVQYLPSMNTAHAERISLENDLHQAIQEGNQFELHYQPQVSLSQRRVIGIEALIRWRHPKHGMISPDAFIPMAEESGLIVGISDWVMQEGLGQLQRLRRKGFTSLKLGINLSPREFERSDLFDRVMNPLAQFDIPKDAVEIEITENLLMKDAESIITKVRQLRRAGIQISIDDFGTRYSSLNYLRRFSISSIKIDQSFVRDLTGGSQDSTAIILAIMGIARSFDLRVLVEGIENAEQLETLIKLGCDEMQGFYFSRPLTADKLETFLSEFSSLFTFSEAMYSAA